MSSRSGSEHNSADTRFLGHSELSITRPVIANSHFTSIVTRTGHATYRHGVSQKRSNGMVLSRPSARRTYCPVGHTVPVLHVVPTLARVLIYGR